MPMVMAFVDGVNYIWMYIMILIWIYSKILNINIELVIETWFHTCESPGFSNRIAQNICEACRWSQMRH